MTFDFRDFSRVLLLSREHFLICYGHGYLFVKVVTGTSKNYQSMSNIEQFSEVFSLLALANSGYIRLSRDPLWEKP